VAAPASIVLVDGEHYPPVTARAIAALRAGGEEPVLALLVGGSEKLGQVAMEVGVPVEAAADAEAALADAIPRVGAGRVIDLSDEPVLGSVRRCRLASVALWRGASYVGADFHFAAPARPPVGDVPSVAVIGMGKRTGKTAVAGQAARAYRDAGLRPVVVAMGRGGPPDPEVITAGEVLDPHRLLRWVDDGRHAASDYIEDALMAGVPTVGAWRAGGDLLQQLRPRDGTGQATRARDAGSRGERSGDPAGPGGRWDPHRGRRHRSGTALRLLRVVPPVAR
jgi:cyclic 2,3-diphosphoglycerate synthetase